MAYRKRTLRTMSPTARKVARLTGEIDSAVRRLRHLTGELQRLDGAAGAFDTLFSSRPFQLTDLGPQNPDNQPLLL